MQKLFFTALILLAGCRTVSRGQVPIYHIPVETGDTLASIATRFNTSWQDIAQENGLQDGRDLRVGQSLRVRPGPGGYMALPKGAKVTYENAEIENDGGQENTSVAGGKRNRRGLLFGGGGNANGASEGNNSATGTGKNKGKWSPLPWPVVGGVSSEYGYRWGRLHGGIDIRARKGTSIFAPASGRVIYSGYKGEYGKFILVDHGTFRTAYGHCSKIHVSVGERIKKGDVLGEVGATGNASGTHLHFEFRLADDRPVDPLYYLQSRSLLSSAAVGDEPGS